MQPPKPWLKDPGEPSLAKSPAPKEGGLLSGQIPVEGYIGLTENDLEMLADYEEEQQRRGHFEMLFPTAKNIDNFRGYLSSNRRANLLLWAYIK